LDIYLYYLFIFIIYIIGEWIDGRINGFGTLTYADGDKYIGMWEDGKMSGQGTYIYGLFYIISILYCNICI
jgi:MORN repeat